MEKRPGDGTHTHILDRFDLKGLELTIKPNLLGFGASGEVYETIDPAIACKISTTSISPSTAETLVGDTKSAPFIPIDLDLIAYDSLLTTDATQRALQMVREGYVMHTILHRTYHDIAIVSIHMLMLLREMDSGNYRIALFMERMHPEGLTALCKDKRFDRATLLRMMLPVSKTLDTLHAHTPVIIQRDVKDTSVLLSFDNKLKLADFGTVGLGDLTKERGLIGSLAFLAPESLKGAYSPASDRYGHTLNIFKMLMPDEDPRSYRDSDAPLRYDGFFYTDFSTGNIVIDQDRLARRLSEGLSLYGGDYIFAEALSKVFTKALDPDPNKRLISAQLVNQLVLELIEKIRIDPKNNF